MNSVSFLSFRELRTSTGKIEEMLANDNKIIVTGNGKPKALMIQINEMNFEDTLAQVNRMKLEQTPGISYGNAEKSQTWGEKRVNLLTAVKKIIADAAVAESDSTLTDSDWDEMTDLRSKTDLDREVKI